MSLLKRLFAKEDEAAPYRPLYAAVVAEARNPVWYSEGGAPDTVDGRFDMVAAILSLVLIRLEREAEGAGPVAYLTELFVSDMDGQLRQIGIGDIVVGKHIGRMVSALGGRLGAYREAFGGGDLKAALARNLWRGEVPVTADVEFIADRMQALHAALDATATATVLAGTLPHL
jgi:cytochrome b pre-mRNA-processing protein 3